MLVTCCNQFYLHETLFRYQRAQLLLSISISMWLHVVIASIFTSWLQINFDFMEFIFEAEQVFLWKKNFSWGHSGTQTWGVGHPLMGTRGPMHFSRSKNIRNGLSKTSLSTPHIRPSESVGKSTRLMSPFFKAVKWVRQCFRMVTEFIECNLP